MKIKALTAAATAALSVLTNNEITDIEFAAALPYAAEAERVGSGSWRCTALHASRSEARMTALCVLLTGLEDKEEAVRKYNNARKVIRDNGGKEAGYIVNKRKDENNSVVYVCGPFDSAAAAAAANKSADAAAATREAKEKIIADQAQALANAMDIIGVLSDLGYGDNADSIVSHARALHAMTISLAATLGCSTAPVDIAATAAAIVADTATAVAA